MSAIFRKSVAAVVGGIVLAAMMSVPAFAVSDDAAKLEELQRAITGPGEGGSGHKTRKRAIVFDNEAQKSEPGAVSSNAAGPTTMGTVDCASLPADVKSTAVDFAIQFKVGSASIAPGSEGTLTNIAKILALSPDKCVLVEGHTDSSGNPEKNLALSGERAKTVVNFIADKAGVDRKRLVPVGKGATDTIKSLDPRDAKNRRVVFKVVSN